MGLGGQRHNQVALPPGKIRYTLYRRLGGPQGPVWTGAENRAPYGIRPLDITSRHKFILRSLRIYYTGLLVLSTLIQLFLLSVLTYTFCE